MRKDRDTKEKVIDVACELFASQGYDGVSIRTIAKEAGVNLSAVNYHFQNKAMLYSQIIHNARIKLGTQVADLVRDNQSTLELSMGIYEAYLENSHQLRHTFSMLLSDVVFDILDQGVADKLGAPGEDVIITSLKKEFGDEISKRAREWVVGAIFCQITHVALMSGTPLMKQFCKLHGERFNPDRFRHNVEHSIRASLQYFKSHHKEL